MWCEWLVLIFSDWWLSTQRVTVCVCGGITAGEAHHQKAHMSDSLCQINALMFIMCKCRKLFLVFLQVMLQANPELHFISLFWFFIEVSKAHVILAYKQWESCSPDLNFLCLAEKWSWSVCTTCRSLNHTGVSVGKDRNPGVHLFHLTCVTLQRAGCVPCVSVGVPWWW